MENKTKLARLRKYLVDELSEPDWRQNVATTINGLCTDALLKLFAIIEA